MSLAFLKTNGQGCDVSRMSDPSKLPGISPKAFVIG
jgi:hypothetical protein